MASGAVHLTGIFPPYGKKGEKLRNGTLGRRAWTLPARVGAIPHTPGLPVPGDPPEELAGSTRWEDVAGAKTTSLNFSRTCTKGLS